MGILQKAGNFLGISKFGQGLSTAGRVITGGAKQDTQQQVETSGNVQKLLYAARNEQDKTKKKRLLDLANSFGAGVSAEQIDPNLNLSNKEVVGSAMNVGLNVLTPGALKGTKTAVLAKNAALGGAFGGASGLEKNRSATGVAGSAVGGALIGAGIGAVGLGVKAIKEYLGNTVPVWMMNKAVKPALQDLKKNVKFGSKTLGEELLTEGVKGGPKKLLEIADTRTNALEDDLQRVLSSPNSVGKVITKDQIRPYLEDLITTKKGIPGLSGDAQRIEGIWKSMPDVMTLTEANQMKRRIYTELRDVSYKIDAKLGAKASTLKQIAKGLKTEIEDAVGGTIIRDINKKLSIYGRLENSMIDQLAREMRNNGIGLTDAILLAGGDTTSLLAILRHLGQGTETYVAQGLSKIKNIGTGKAGQATTSIIKKSALNIP